MCGENVVSRVSPCCLWGITPACAGKTEEHLFYKHLYRDHPRVCGENSMPVDQRLIFRGSPPRVRGKLISIPYQTKCVRITPACAGKTISLSSVTVEARDHPRVCGENMLIPPYSSVSQGSPPRVRGKRYSIHARFVARRITPACAGKTEADYFYFGKC